MREPLHPGESGKNGEKLSHYMIIIPYIKNKFKNETKKKVLHDGTTDSACVHEIICNTEKKVLFHFKTNDMTMKMKR